MAASTSDRLGRQRHAGRRSGRRARSVRLGRHAMTHERFAEILRLLAQARDTAHDNEFRVIWEQKLRLIKRIERSEANLHQQER